MEHLPHMVSNHDPLCIYQDDGYGDSCEICRCIAEARADEREKIAQAIEAMDPVDWALAGMDAGRDAARIARGGTP